MVDPLNAIPNQTNILDQIAEMEADQEADTIDEDIKYAAIEQEDELVEVSRIEIIQYTDAAGNEFEATVVNDFITDEDEDAVLDQMLVPVAPQRVKFAIDNTEEEPETSTEFDFDLNFEEDDDKPSPDFFL